MFTEELLTHIHDTEWLKTLVEQYLTSELSPIVEHHQVAYWYTHDEPASDETEFYKERGIRLFSESVPGQDVTSEGNGDVYLLQTGGFVTVSESTDETKILIQHHLGQRAVNTTTSRQPWTSEQVESNKLRIVEQLASIDKIRTLATLCRTEAPPQQLVEVIGVITDELIKYLAKHPKALYALRPRQFEELIAEILASYGWEIQITPATRDGGYDIFGISRDISGMRTSWIIECKKYGPDQKVGIAVARALYAVKLDRGAANAMLATTSHFTKGVEDFTAKRYDFSLRDYDGIIEWINVYRPSPAGKPIVRDSGLVIPTRW